MLLAAFTFTWVPVDRQVGEYAASGIYLLHYPWIAPAGFIISLLLHFLTNKSHAK